MTDVSIATGHDSITAALEVPAGVGPWPGVVIVHDAFGLGRDQRDITRRVADHGYLALSPDLYARGGRAKCVRAVFGDLMRRRGRTVDDILAARDHLAGRDDCTGKVAVAGFCLGGGFALIVAPEGFAAAAPFYPTLTGGIGGVLDGTCPIVASLGRRDPVNIGTERKLREGLDRRGIPYDVHTYPHVGHSFANQIPGLGVAKIVGLGYDAHAADDSWRRVFAFFDTHLR
ncbi:MAG TPA: dienelactone hydrolase family protein [Aldersonia sp.]